MHHSGLHGNWKSVIFSCILKFKEIQGDVLLITFV